MPFICKSGIEKTMDYTNIMKHKKAYLSQKEIDDMLAWCYDKKRIRDYVLILTLARTGRRVTEIVGEKPYIYKVGLRPCDIIPDLSSIEWDILKKKPIKKKRMKEEKLKELKLVKKPKRALKPVDDEYIKILIKYIKTNNIKPYDRVFPITSRRVRDIIYEVSKASEVLRPNMKIHPHMFRHSYAINMLKKNSNNPATTTFLQKLLDHSDINITQAYLQFTPEDMLGILEKTFGDDDE